MLSLHINWCFINYFTHKTWLLSKTKSYTGNNPENISKISSIIYHFLNGWNVSFYVIILNLNAYRIPHVFWACWKHHIKFHMFMTSLIMMHCKYLKIYFNDCEAESLLYSRMMISLFLIFSPKSSRRNRKTFKQFEILFRFVRWV